MNAPSAVQIQKSLMWRELLVGLGVDFVLCFVAWWYFKPENGGHLWEVGAFFLVLQVALIVFVFRSFIVRVSLLLLTDAEFLENQFLSSLKTSKLPAPESYHRRDSLFFDDFACDPDMPADERVNAAYYSSSMGYAKERAGIARAMIIESAMERALQRYWAGLPTNQK